MRINEIDRICMVVRERERESKRIEKTCSAFDVENIVRNINKGMDYGKKRCKKDKSFFESNLSFLCANEKGITLLALILTVVIMIILAAVTINVALGEGGLVDQAKWAAEQTANSTKSEHEQLDDVADQINDIIAGIGTGDTNSTGGEETNSVETNSVDTNTVDTNSVEETNTVDTNTIEPEPEPIPEGTITIGEAQWQEDGTAKVSVTSSESKYIIQYQINGTEEKGWKTVQDGIVAGVNHGDTVYARLTDGEQYSEVQNKKIEDTTAPVVTVTAQGSPTTNSITVTAQAVDNETGMVTSPKYTYYIKKSTETESSYKTPSGAENITNAQYTFTGLTQGTNYDIKVEVNGDKAGNKGTGTLTNQTTATVPGADAGLVTGAITASPATWSSGKASITLTTTTNFQIEYQVGETTGSWTKRNSPVIVGNLNHGDTVYARLTDGINAGNSASITILDKKTPTLSIGTGAITENSIEIKVTASSDGESGLADTNTYKYYVNNELKYTGTQTSYTITGLSAGTSYTIKVEAYDKAGNVGTATTTATTVKNVPESTSYVGYYADVDGNGTVDGVIYADLAIGGSGEWNPGNYSWAAENQTGTYTIPKGSNFKKYKVSKTGHSDDFGTKDVLTVANSSGNERFYVMALDDVDSRPHNWYNEAYGNMSDYAKTTSTSFGSGKHNTKNMIAKWNSSAYGSQNGDSSSPDIWGLSAVQSKINANPAWYVPSKEEWAAFGDNLAIDSSSSEGLSSWYWSSSQYNTNEIWYANFDGCFMGYIIVNLNYSVRLGATF